MEDEPKPITDQTFSSYFEASERKQMSTSNVDTINFKLYSYENLKPLLMCTTLLLLRTFWLYIVPLFAVASSYLFSRHYWDTFSISVLLVALFYCIYERKRDSCVTRKKGYNYLGATMPLGLYFDERVKRIKNILATCPILTSVEVLSGSLPGNGVTSTPLVFTGDLRTFLPFILFQPPQTQYTRRWVRVPLADGPLFDISNTEERNAVTVDTIQDRQYEAVALDCAFSSRNTSNSMPNFDKTHHRITYLVLAGLTGGSSEGYVLDFVHSANAQGCDCFVMLGRGLGGTPCLSDAAFHGARTSDVKAAAEAIRASLHPGDKLFVVGFSLGGIIVTNAIARQQIDCVDGAVSISGCFDTAKNINFAYSRKLWQPLLAFGLKENFVAREGAAEKMSRRLGPNVKRIVEGLTDVIDFDSVIVTGLNRFRDVYHYYSDMCGASDSCLRENIAAASAAAAERNKSEVGKVSPDIVANGDGEASGEENVGARAAGAFSFSRPLLCVQAADDPIIHVDTMPHPSLLRQIGNLVCLVTARGGHVGWPLGWTPWHHRWAFQNKIILEFCNAVAATSSS